MDISDILETRELSDSLLGELSLRFVALPTGQIGPAMAQTNAFVMAALGLERGMLIEREGDTGSRWRSHWFPSGSDGESFTPCFKSHCPLCGQWLQGKRIQWPNPVGPSIRFAPEGPACCAMDFPSALGFSLLDEDKVLGALLYVFPDERKSWPESWVARLDFIARVFAAALARKRRELSLDRPAPMPVRPQPGNAVQNFDRCQELKGRLQRNEAFVAAILKSIPAELAVVDRTGAIVMVNEAWERFALENGGDPAAVSCGVNYLEVCRRAGDGGDELARQAAQAIEDVVRGASTGSRLEYPCASARAPRWFLMSVTPFQARDFGALILHSDITELKVAQESLRNTLAEVERLKSHIQHENAYLRERVRANSGHHRVVGQSQAIRQVLTQAEQVAATDSTVLLLGETGTGKELIATSIHDLSARRERSLVSVNCAIMPAALVESELFGREKGAFTGSLARQVGRFELADHSTIFLDEVAELPPEVQAKLLRVLETRQIERLGNPKPVPVDVRIIAATNRNLEEAIAQGKFRQDLYYRLNVFPITMPALRERREDIPLLIWAFIEEFTKTFNKNIETIDRDNMEELQAYAWPGNIRELRNLIERAMIVAHGPQLRIPLPSLPTPIALAQPQKLEAVDREYVLGVLEKSGWRIRGPNGAALKLGLRPTTLEARMAKLGIRRPSSAAMD